MYPAPARYAACAVLSTSQNRAAGLLTVLLGLTTPHRHGPTDGKASTQQGKTDRHEGVIASHTAHPGVYTAGWSSRTVIIRLLIVRLLIIRLLRDRIARG
jgi:hypothetical protein